MVRQELYGLLLAHSSVRWWMQQSAREVDLDPDRLSFTHAIEVLDTACYECAIVAREELPRLTERLMADLRDPSTLVPPRRQACLFLLRRKQPWQEGFSLKKQPFRDILLI